MEEKLLTAEQVAIRWAVKKDFVLKRASEKWAGLKLPFIGMGRAKRFRLSQVEEFERVLLLPTGANRVGAMEHTSHYPDYRGLPARNTVKCSAQYAQITATTRYLERNTSFYLAFCNVSTRHYPPHPHGITPRSSWVTTVD